MPRRAAAHALTVTVVAALTLAGPPAGAAPAGTGAAGQPAAKPGAANAHVVTLVTGDKVVLIDGPDGRHRATVERGPGRAGMPFVQRTGKDTAGRDQLRVIPADALPLLAAGRLDARLFDVTALARLGYDDRTRSDIPLIVSYPPGQAAPRAAIAGTTVHRALPSVNGAALREPKNTAGQFWSTLTSPSLAAAPAKVWLDGRSRLLDEDSNTQIGVPAARAAGLTGKGVTVAVLDSGVDATHPDLAGVVTETRDFSDSGGADDPIGHGTHVSGIIAGSGGASADGVYRGVATDAKLIVGRVCATRFCADSAVLAGMEWAATERHARIVNMSLGSELGSDGTDPLSTAVNNLTASTGTLFVVAAGNAGAPGTVGAPGSADAALTVASVGRTDALSSFSSQGPRIGDFAVKPDVAAPGEDIVAPRATGTDAGTPVNDLYTSLSGTSMATPHVAGAAAILLQQHPDWTAARLKSALMSTAKPVDATVYGQGAGRVDVARAVTQPVTVEPAGVSFGLQRWPFADKPPASRTVTYRNDGDAAVPLSLSVDATDPSGSAASSGAFTVSAATVTVPAHGTADVALTMHPDALGTAKTGAFSGRIVATGPGGVTVQTAFGATTEPESFDVKVRMIDRAGKPAGATLPLDLSFVLLDRTGGGEDPTTPPVVDGAVTVRMPKGAYGVSSFILTDDPAEPGRVKANAAVAAVPRLVVDRPGIRLTFDARRARKAEAVVDSPHPAVVRTDVTNQWLVKTDGGEATNSVGIVGGPGNQFFATPVTGDKRVFAFGFQQMLTATGQPGSRQPDRVYFLAIPFLGRIPDPRFRLRDRDLHRTDAVYRAQGVDAAIGDRVEFPFFLPGQSLAGNDILATPMPTRRLELHSPGVRWSGPMLQQYLPAGPRLFFEGQIDVPDTVYRAGRFVRQDWNRAAFAADLAPPNFINGISRDGNTLRSTISSFGPSEPIHTGNPISDIFVAQGTAVLSRDGTVIGTRFLPSFSSFTVPGDTGRYTLTIDATRAKPWAALSTRVTTAWTFTSGPPATPGEKLPLPTVKVWGDFDGSNRARAGAPFRLLLSPATQAGAAPSAITAVTLEVSGDDGVTFQPVRVNRGRDGQWCARLTNPTGTFASLRVTATNAAGNTVVHTIIRAYGLTAG